MCHPLVTTYSRYGRMSNLRIINKLIFCLETGKWSSLEEMVQKCSHHENRIEQTLNLKQKDILQKDDKKQFFSFTPKITGEINKVEEIQSKEKTVEIKKNIESALVIGDSLGEVQVSYANVKFIANSLIIITVFYLVACSIAPLVNLNNQTFRVIFTLVGGIPSILFDSKVQTSDK